MSCRSSCRLDEDCEHDLHYPSAQMSQAYLSTQGRPRRGATDASEQPCAYKVAPPKCPDDLPEHYGAEGGDQSGKYRAAWRLRVRLIRGRQTASSNRASAGRCRGSNLGLLSLIVKSAKTKRYSWAVAATWLQYSSQLCRSGAFAAVSLVHRADMTSVLSGAGAPATEAVRLSASLAKAVSRVSLTRGPRRNGGVSSPLPAAWSC